MIYDNIAEVENLSQPTKIKHMVETIEIISNLINELLAISSIPTLTYKIANMSILWFTLKKLKLYKINIFKNNDMKELSDISLQLFKGFGHAVIVLAVFIFILSWMIKTKPNNKLQNYSVVCYDVFGNESIIDGLRIEFQVHDVAWSFMKQYKKSYPLHSFALVVTLPNSEKKTIVKYI